MTSDEMLRADVLSELQGQPSLCAARICVRTRNGTVTLSGHVGTFAEKHRVDVAIRHLLGVKTFETHLSIKRG